MARGDDQLTETSRPPPIARWVDQLSRVNQAIV